MFALACKATSTKEFKMPTALQIETPPLLVVRKSDFSPGSINALNAIQNGSRLLGVDEPVQAIFDELPGVVARRLKKVVPDDFTLTSITFNLALSVDVPGFNVGGTVEVTLSSKD
jgi:hypothetical protein